jgi:hypothetical protein
MFSNVLDNLKCHSKLDINQFNFCSAVRTVLIGDCINARIFLSVYPVMHSVDNGRGNLIIMINDLDYAITAHFFPRLRSGQFS